MRRAESIVETVAVVPGRDAVRDGAIRRAESGRSPSTNSPAASDRTSDSAASSCAAFAFYEASMPSGGDQGSTGAGLVISDRDGRRLSGGRESRPLRDLPPSRWGPACCESLGQRSDREPRPVHVCLLPRGRVPESRHRGRRFEPDERDATSTSLAAEHNLRTESHGSRGRSACCAARGARYVERRRVHTSSVRSWRIGGKT